MDAESFKKPTRSATGLRVIGGMGTMTEKGSNHQLLKRKNLSLLMKYIYLNSPISRVELAQALALTTPAITGLIAPLLAHGLLQETCVQSSDSKGAGRPRVMLEYAPTVFYSLGVDVSPYHIHYVLTDFQGNTVAVRRSTQVLDVYERTLALLAREIPAFLAESGVPAQRLLGVGICLPGLIDGSADKIYTTFRDGWTEHNLCAELGGILGVRVEVENNVRARAICAELFDRAVQSQPCAYFFVSYGVSCQLIMDGRVLYGQKAAAGEIGHTVMQRNGPMCPTCGNRGCLEALAGERAVLQRCREGMQRGGALWRLSGGPDSLTIPHVLQAQQENDPVAESVMEDAIEYLGIALANTINLVSPRSVLLDGRILSTEHNQGLLLRCVERNMFRVHKNETTFRFLPYDPDQGARAAAAVVIGAYLQNAGEGSLA